MDLTAWDTGIDKNGLWLELFIDDEGTGRVRVSDWMARLFGSALLGDLDFRERTRRDEGRRMRVGVPSGQVFCEPCYLEIDAPGIPAMTRAPNPIDDDPILECCCCKFTKRNREESDACQVEPCSMVFDSGADTG